MKKQMTELNRKGYNVIPGYQTRNTAVLRKENNLILIQLFDGQRKVKNTIKQEVLNVLGLDIDQRVNI